MTYIKIKKFKIMHQVCIIYTYFHKLLLSVLNVEILKIARVVVILFFVVSISIYIEICNYVNGGFLRQNIIFILYFTAKTRRLVICIFYYFQHIKEPDRIKDRFNIMKSIFTFAKNMQTEIYFTIGKNYHNNLKEVM